MRLFFAALICWLMALPTKAQYLEIFQAKDLNRLLQASEHDSVLYLERLTAIYFHDLLNQYRVENKLKALAWDDTLWLASRNHNIWMLKNNQITHQQQENTKDYSGRSPGERHEYLLEKGKRSPWSGENCLMHFTAASLPIEIQANLTAKSSLSQWVRSKGHNDNILNPNHDRHGAAFIISGPHHKVIGTDLYAKGPSLLKAPPALPARKQALAALSNQSSTMQFSSIKGKDSKQQATQTQIKPVSAAIRKELQKEFYFLNVKSQIAGKAKQENRLKDKAVKWVNEQLQNAGKNKELAAALQGKHSHTAVQFEESELSPLAEIFKAKKTRKISVLTAIHSEKLSMELISKSIWEGWKNEIQNRQINFSKYGYHFDVKKKKEMFLICAAIVVK